MVLHGSNFPHTQAQTQLAKPSQAHTCSPAGAATAPPRPFSYCFSLTASVQPHPRRSPSIPQPHPCVGLP